MSAREFSSKCSNCRQRAVTLACVAYDTIIEHDGRAYSIAIKDLTVPRCTNCGAIALDEEANRQISAAFRKAAGLLTPEQIRQYRTALGLTQQELADHLAIAVSTLSRWETGAQIQQRSLDRFLRAFFALPELRQGLAQNTLLTASAT